MTYKELKLKIKQEQKALARAIRKGKSARKPSNRNEENIGFYEALFWNRINYRYNHIVYCNMFNRTPYEKIEQPREWNTANKHRLDTIRKEWESLLDEQIICDNS
jgi:hypothetical protein